MAAHSEIVCCEIEASVVTGFEDLAAEEVKEKIGTESKVDRGRINFFVGINDVKKILDLCSVDNLAVVIKHYHQFEFADTLEENLIQFEKIVPELDWPLGLRVWQEIYGPAISHVPCTNTTTASTAPTKNNEEDLSTDTTSTNTITKEGDANTTTETTDNNDMDTTCAETNITTSKADTTGTNVEATSRIPSFRATCYRSGSKHLFQSPQAAVAFGGSIQDHFGWRVDLKNFDVEVMLTIAGRHVYASIALTRESLHRRHIVSFGPTALRPTIAYGMLRLCRIQPADVVCDPMCGGGSIPIEAAINWPSAIHLCGDSNKKAVCHSLENIDAINRKYPNRVPVTPTQWDVCSLPMMNNSVDVFVTDLPFGKRSGSRMANWQLYPAALSEMARVSRLNTGRACLLTQDKKCILSALKSVSSLWCRGVTLATNIGGLSTAVYLLHRTAKAVGSAPLNGTADSQTTQVQQQMDSSAKESE